MPNLNNTTPIDPSDPGEYKILLGDLQGNIIKSHGRDHSVHLFIQFKADKQEEAKKWIQGFAQKYVTSAILQDAESIQYKANKVKGSVFANICLSITGYEYLDVPPFKIPHSEAFRMGMKSDSVVGFLGDPPVNTWDYGLRQDVHALLLIADDDIIDLLQEVNRISETLLPVGLIVHREDGFILRNEAGQVIEHFGFADGISQPIFVTSDLDKAKETDPTFDKWNPTAPLSLVLETDPNGKTADSYGSYLVYRKLEQNVKAFHEDQKRLASTVGINEDLAGALIVGRFADGTPVVESNAPTGATLTNNFNYDSDPQEFGLDPKATKCPFHAHVRKTNPRGDTGRVNNAQNFEQSLEVERLHRIARRAVSYGENDMNKKPVSGSGLLFLCFQANPENQFNFMQAAWANQNNFVKVNVGPDPVIGQPQGTQKYPKIWGDPNTEECPYDFKLWVNMKGGEYFYTPSMSYLKSISESALPLNKSTSLAFNGSDGYITINADSVFNLTNNFTIEAWFKPDKLEGVQRILSKLHAYGFGLSGKKLFFTTYDIKDYETIDLDSLKQGEWNHLAVTLNSSNDASFYVNGEFVQAVNGNKPANISSNSVEIGRKQDNNIEYCDGNILDVRLWNIERTQDEIKANMNNLLTGYETGLIGYWTLNQGSGTVIEDNAANVNNGVIHGGVTWDVR